MENGAKKKGAGGGYGVKKKGAGGRLFILPQALLREPARRLFIIRLSRLSIRQVLTETKAKSLTRDHRNNS